MSLPALVPLAVWMVTVSLGATEALPGRVAVAVPTRSFQPAMLTAAVPAFWTVTVVSVGVICAAVILTGEAAAAVAAAGKAAGEAAGAAGFGVGAAGAAAGAQATSVVSPSVAAR